MAEHAWPLKNKLPADYVQFTKSDLVEFLDLIEDDETPVWIDNYWQIKQQITQRPIELLYISEDGAHFA
ncbi:hypothetical protein GCM10009785_18400 [Brooklawnia cerclae]|uniref:Uncharacterized protein n=1 Tax=Brooklawnia cerclae TaxID=349934 RepID=A0ABX0SGS0_9ACTN|nr:hypothetical protein [Brooklawnia cerclae]NIH57588.1 hypothetical protein [Brooklawnia cerclae]